MAASLGRLERVLGRSSWNPLDCTGTSLAAPQLLAGKLLLLYILVAGVSWRPEAFAPFLSFLGEVPGLVLTRGGQLTFLAGALGLLLNRHVRLACFAIGASILLAILANRAAYQNNVVAMAFLFLLLACQDRRRPPSLIQAQIVVIYFGAGLNKLLEADWRSGQFFEFWAGEHLALPHYLWLAERLPEMALGRLLGWGTIVTELGLAILFARRGTIPIACTMALAFHGSILVFSEGRLSWVFLYVMACMMLCLARWDERQPDHWSAQSRVHLALAGMFFAARGVWG